MLEFRTEVPRAFEELYRSVRQALKLTPNQVSHVTPSTGEYRKRGNIVTAIKRGASSFYLLLESRAGVRCAVDPDYLTYILQKYPRAMIYMTGFVRGDGPIVVVEEDKTVRFLLMPMNVGHKELEPA
jgi:hypothetical protein